MAKKLKKISDEKLFEEAWRRGAKVDSELAAVDMRTIEMSANGKH